MMIRTAQGAEFDLQEADAGRYQLMSPAYTEGCWWPSEEQIRLQSGLALTYAGHPADLGDGRYEQTLEVIPCI